ncbi:MAG: Fe-S cluster assembly ATPase SufC [Candidatus Melainabacteria bacterium]|jgi:Fe-S cluster assembly ATP-binding protein|nr:Fe-S cluster assembly ATPase SufC [Candidatus Melainabacteria bacterium]NBV98320.1 Fe-S cluster assembly ATPase SufC [Pseudomonadota bacterium]
MTETILEVKNLEANLEDGDKILKGLNLTIKAGEVHAIMGPNGSGKSTLSKILSGHPAYKVSSGSMNFLGQDLNELEANERANLGLFLAFQYPLEIAGVNNLEFLRMAYNSKQKYHGLEEADPLDFDDLVESKLEILSMKNDFLNRNLNEGFSGGEKKKNEILQMLILEPKLVVLDEIDSGLDIDALKAVANGINAYKNAGNAVLMITHYQRLLDYVVPDQVHVLSEGRIVLSGKADLALELEKKGYDILNAKLS